MEKIGKIKFFMGFLSWFASGRPVAQNTLVPVSNLSNSSQKYSECIKSMAKFYQPDLGASLMILLREMKPARWFAVDIGWIWAIPQSSY
jgi:hypothetical protein